MKAKSATYVGSRVRSLSYRPGSHDLQFHEGAFSYLDSYFGGADFLGREVVYYEGQPVWAMNYYGRILEPALITGLETGQIIQESLSQMYRAMMLLHNHTVLVTAQVLSVHNCAAGIHC